MSASRAQAQNQGKEAGGDLREHRAGSTDYDQLEELLDHRLDKSLKGITLAKSFDYVVFAVIRRAEAEGWTANLVIRARDMAPGNTKLLGLAQQFGLASTDTSRQSLE
jgi:Effector-associated domain 1